LAEAVLYAAKELDNVALSVRTTTALPLEEDSSRPRVDYIAFLVDMTNQHSLVQLKQFLLRVDKDYFVQGKACIIATRADLKQSYAFTTLELESVAETYDLRLFYCNLLDKELEEDLARRVVRNVQLTSGLVPGAGSALFFRSLAERPIISSTQRTGGEELQDGAGGLKV